MTSEQHPVLEFVEAQRAGCTARQLDVLRRRAAGHSWRRIARDLRVSPRTVHDHADAALAKIRRHHEQEAST